MPRPRPNGNRNLRVNRLYGFPLWGKLSPQVTDEGESAGSFPLIRRASAPPSPIGEGFSLKKYPPRCKKRRGGFVFIYRRQQTKEVWGLTNEEFTGLMQQYQRLVYTVCLQFVHNPHTAEDLTQDTFLSAFSAIDRCEPQYYKQWLVRVAANKCKDHLKSAWVRRVEAPGDDAMPEPSTSPGSDTGDPAEQLANRAGAEELAELVRALREPYGRIAVLYFLEHKETAEIAALVGRPPATVNSQLWRAKNLLRQQILERRQRE